MLYIVAFLTYILTMFELKHQAVQKKRKLKNFIK